MLAKLVYMIRRRAGNRDRWMQLRDCIADGMASATRAEQYAPAADGQRFLIRVPAGETSFPPATVV
jgi:hypothetical protein